MWRGRFSAMAKRIVIVGGGITGLSAAHAAVTRARALGQDVAREVAVTVLERSHRFGGNLITERENGFLLDAGADSWVASKPEATALAKELGLERALIGTNEANRRYYVAWENRLHAVPEGLVLGVPTRLGPLARSRLFSWRGKLRMAFEPFVPARRFAADDDESIADFARRRLGAEAAERLVCPLLGGISAGEASDVSMRAAFPQLVAMESEHGSLVRAMRAAARVKKMRIASPANGPSTSTFLSLEGGVEDLVRALAARLREERVTLRSGTPVDALVRDGSRWKLTLGGGEIIDADAVLLAVPARVSATILRPVDPELERLLAAVPFRSSATLFLAYRRADVGHPLDGVGFVAPMTPGRSVLASTWVSSKWRGRAPEGHVLLRVFFGGAPGSEGGEAVARDERALADVARSELRSLMGLGAEPLFTRLFRFDAARAQMRVGHLAMMRGVRERLSREAAGVRIAGEGHGGAGIPDCIRQGEEAGRALVDWGR
jgi:oxygen-dependent protoporphyrinogen oxidase